MRQTLVGLANEGVDITVICPETDNSDIINFGGIKVLPVLKEKSRTSLKLHERIQNLHHLAAAVENADIIWTLDTLFPLRVEQPIVLTLQTIAYEEELNSLCDFNWDVLVAASHYLGSVVEAVAGPAFWTGTPPVIRVILNGIDTDSFVPTDPASLIERMSLPASKFLLFPHRPEAAKGFDIALLALQQLASAGFDYKLLIPTNPSSVRACLDKERRYYRRLYQKIEKLGLESSVIFHPWISLKDLPAYYSLGESCLMLSALPEGFGFTTIQSVSCGTPVVSTKAGSLRERLPPSYGVTYVEFGAVDSVVSAILDPPKRSEILRGQEYVRATYALDRYVREYLDCFEKASKNISRYTGVRSEILSLSPWCYVIDLSTIWHDLEMRRIELTRKEVNIIRQILEGADSFDFSQYANEIEKLLRRGVLVYSQSSKRI
jgi:glycosyltransferase involved in cell wall biosynthesis